MNQALSDNPAFTRSILATAVPEEISARLDTFSKEHLESGLREVFFCELSVGAAFGLCLQDGRRVLLKAHKLEWSAEFLEAVRRVQGHLFKRGFPCPRPLAGPASFGPGLATAEEFVGEGEPVDAHEPVVRCRMAQALARAIELAAEVKDVGALSSGWAWPKDDLWPVPHNALFNFEATAAGAGWIDEIAAGAKRVMNGFHGRVVVGHADWSVKHFRFAGGEVRVVYDWDSLRACADRSWAPGRTTFPTVASPALPDEPSHDDDHLREGHPEINITRPRLSVHHTSFLWALCHELVLSTTQRLVAPTGEGLPFWEISASNPRDVLGVRG